MIIINIVSIIDLYRSNNEVNNLASLHIGIKQLTQRLVTAQKITVSNNQLVYINNEDSECIVKLKDNRLVETPGFIVYTRGVSDVSFTIKGVKVFINLKKDDIEYQYLIAVDYSNYED